MALVAPSDFIEGSAEPWIVDVLCSLLVASGQKVVLETGTFMGATGIRLAQTLNEHMGGAFLGCELDPDRALATQSRFEKLALPLVNWTIYQQDVLQVIAAQPDESLGFVWLDDDHTHEHVDAELAALLPKMKPGGLICGHDVYGLCDLRQEFTKYGGYSLDLPRLGPAGGLGLLQV